MLGPSFNTIVGLKKVVLQVINICQKSEDTNIYTVP